MAKATKEGMDRAMAVRPKAGDRVVEQGCEILHGGRVTRTWSRWSDGHSTYADYAESTLTVNVGGIMMSVGTACCGSGEAPIPEHVAMYPSTPAGGTREGGEGA